MSLHQQAKRSLLRVVNAYQAVQPTTDGVLSKSIYGASWFIEKLRENDKSNPRSPAVGPAFGLHIYDRIIVWFEEHWPVGAEWPKDVPHDGKLARIPVTTRKKAKDTDGKKGSGKAKARSKK